MKRVNGTSEKPNLVAQLFDRLGFHTYSQRVQDHPHKVDEIVSFMRTSKQQGGRFSSASDLAVLVGLVPQSQQNDQKTGRESNTRYLVDFLSYVLSRSNPNDPLYLQKITVSPGTTRAALMNWCFSQVLRKMGCKDSASAVLAFDYCFVAEYSEGGSRSDLRHFPYSSLDRADRSFVADLLAKVGKETSVWRTLRIGGDTIDEKLCYAAGLSRDKIGRCTTAYALGPPEGRTEYRFHGDRLHLLPNLRT